MHDLEKALLIVLADGPVFLLGVLEQYAYLAAMPLFRLRLRQSDMGDLRVGEGTPGNQIGEASRASQQQGVAHRLERLPAREMAELMPVRGTVACGVDVFDVRL